MWNMIDRFFEIFETDNPLSVKYIKGDIPINEGLIKTYPINNTVEYIKRLFGLRDNQLNMAMIYVLSYKLKTLAKKFQ